MRCLDEKVVVFVGLRCGGRAGQMPMCLLLSFHWSARFGQRNGRSENVFTYSETEKGSWTFIVEPLLLEFERMPVLEHGICSWTGLSWHSDWKVYLGESEAGVGSRGDGEVLNGGLMVRQSMVLSFAGHVEHRWCW